VIEARQSGGLRGRHIVSVSQSARALGLPPLKPTKARGAWPISWGTINCGGVGVFAWASQLRCRGLWLWQSDDLLHQRTRWIRSRSHHGVL
jgi:hypothetical protein